MDLKGRCALVTGGAVRIGAAICRALAAEGCNVGVHYDRSRAEAEALVSELRRSGVRAASVRARLDREGEAAGAVDLAWEALGSLDILVNNAAVFHKGRLEDATEGRIRGELEVNLLAPVLSALQLARRLSAARADRAVAARRGDVVNLLDRRVAGVEAGCLPYLLSKLALADFTLAAAIELAPHLRVNGVAPGAVLPPPGMGDDYLKDAAGFIPLKERPRPDEVAAAVVFLLKADSVTGQIVYVDGGQHLCGGRVTGRD